MKIKGFDKDLKCRGMQFEIGKEYKIENKGKLKLCTDTVFHYCDTLQNVDKYYSAKNENKNRFCEIEVLGEEITDGEKYGCPHIKIVREIVGEELEMLKGHINGNTGDWNTGNWNTGNRNTGNRNTGNWNTGNWNKCDYSNGFFNTKEPTVNIFNVDSGMTAKEFKNSKYYAALISVPFVLTEWVNYTEEEMKKDNTKKLIGGYLKKYSYKEACATWWNKISERDKEIIKSIPNFSKEIFEEITGIDVEEEM